MKKIAAIVTLLTLLCSTTSFAQSSKDITSTGEYVSKEKNQFYEEMTKSEYIDLKSSSMAASLLSEQSYGKGISKLSLDSLSKDIIAYQEQKHYDGFKSYLTKTDSKHYKLEIIPIVGIENIIHYDFRETIPYTQYLLSKNSNNTVSIIYRGCYVQTTGGMWSLKDPYTPIFNYDLIRQAGIQKLKTLPIRASLQKQVNDGVTAKGIENKYERYTLSKSSYFQDGKSYPVPDIQLYKKEGGSTIKITALGSVYTISEYKSLINDYKERKINPVNHGSYITFNSYDHYDPAYSEFSLIKAKDGKHYLVSYVSVSYDNSKKRVPISIVKKYIKDLDTLRGESNVIVRGNPS